MLEDVHSEKVCLQEETTERLRGPERGLLSGTIDPNSDS
jgi:hypothetical protein